MALSRLRSAGRAWALVASILAVACAEPDSFIGGGGDAGGDAPGGQSNDGGNGAGVIAGGNDNGGAPSTGGMAQGGMPATGGAATGGAATGGGGTGGGPNLDDYPPEVEANNTIGTANGLAANALGWSASLSTASDIDSFYFDVPIGSTVSVTISDGQGSCPPDATVTLSAFGPDTIQIGTKTGLCPRLDGTNVASFQSAPVGGTYFVQVHAAAPVASYVVEVSVAAPVCGDNVVQIGEECDDGNATPGDGCEPDCTNTPFCGDGIVQATEECDDANMVGGDGCSAACLLEGNFCPEAEPNNTLATASPIVGCDGGAGVIAPVGDQDFYAIDVPAGGSIRAEVVDALGLANTCPTGFDSVIRLYDPNGVQLGSDDDGGFNACSLITPSLAYAQNLPAGTYTVSVEEFGNNAISLPYVLLLRAAAPGCGDGLVQAGEQCDDGNVTDGDGCSATCQIEGNFCGETEPNNTYLTSSPIAACDGGAGQITPVADKDFFSFTLGMTASVRVEVVDVVGLPNTCPVGFDSVVRLYNSGGVELTSDDDGGFNACSLINPAVNAPAQNLPAGTYYVSVEEFGNNASGLPYVVLVTPM